MFEYRDEHFRSVTGDPAVAARLATLDSDRADAIAKVRMRVIIGLALVISGFFALRALDLPPFEWVGAIIGLIIVAVLAWMPLDKLGGELKVPVLEAVARVGGLTYMPGGFEPPVYPLARPVLFGGGFDSQRFTDLFHGEEDGRRLAFYEAHLTRRGAKNSTIVVFSGLVFAFERRPGQHGTIAIIPDRWLLNMFRPGSGMERVKYEDDPAFDRKFEAYGTDPIAVRLLLSRVDLRRALLDLAATGRVSVYLTPDNALIAVAGKDRFEPGSMLSRKPALERVRAMFDDCRSAYATLQRLRGLLG